LTVKPRDTQEAKLIVMLNSANTDLEALIMPSHGFSGDEPGRPSVIYVDMVLNVCWDVEDAPSCEELYLGHHPLSRRSAV
jgi:hypothetical protein